MRRQTAPLVPPGGPLVGSLPLGSLPLGGVPFGGLPVATLLLGGLLAGPALAQAPAAPARGYQGAAGWAWFGTGADLPRCVQTTTETLRGAGYVVDRVAPGEDAVVAGREGNFMLVSCIIRHNVVSVAWNGRDPEGSRAVIRQLNAALGNRNAAASGAASGPQPGPARGAPPVASSVAPPTAPPVAPSGGLPAPTPRNELPLKPR